MYRRLIEQFPIYKAENTAVGIRHADHVAPSNPQKLALTSPTSHGRSVGIVRSRTQAAELVIWLICVILRYTTSWNLAMET
jgi:hypothetical protein